MVDQAILDEVVRRIVKATQPERIILFGSAARGEAGPDSDLDLLVVKPGKFVRREVEERAYLSLFGIPTPVDVIVVTPNEIEEFRDRIGAIIPFALEEGKEVYVSSEA